MYIKKKLFEISLSKMNVKINKRTPIEEDVLRYKGESYHPYHFQCTLCACELNSSARETRGELYCPRCLDKLHLPICAACRTPIDQERIVNALGKQWHVEHFACAKCERPFHGSRHFEKRGLAYCETDYNLLFGDLCFICNKTVSGDGIEIIFFEVKI